MKRAALALVTLLITTCASSAQNPVRVYSTPPVPPQESLDPLNLKLAWRTYLPTEQRRDGIFSVQILDQPGGRGQQILVQTRSGLIVALDGDSGVTQWRARVGNPYTVSNLLGHNTKSIFAIIGMELFAINRSTGVVEWQFTLPHAATSSPVADEDRIYITEAGRLQSYAIPKGADTSPAGVEKRLEALPERAAAPAPEPVAVDQSRSASVLGSRAQGIQAVSAVSSRGQAVRSVGPLASLSAGGQLPAGGPQPQFLWEYLADSPLELAPLYTTNFVAVASFNGVFYVMSNEDGRHLYRLQAGPPLTAPLGKLESEDIAYVASEDYSVYALDVVQGHVLWRFAAGGPVKRRPIPTANDVYVSAERAGLYRVDRKTGDAVWLNRQADRFLGANNKYVYAADPSGRLLILDLARGNVLASFAGSRDFVVPISNGLTDRIFLASNDGLLVCIHDRDYPKPMHLAPSEPAAAPAPAKKAPAKAKAEDETPAKPKAEDEAPSKPKDESPDK
jgi:outer membrane protein assembly factor BamB